VVSFGSSKSATFGYAKARAPRGGPLQIQGSAPAVSYDLEAQIATEIMMFSLPLSLSQSFSLSLSLLSFVVAVIMV